MERLLPTELPSPKEIVLCRCRETTDFGYIVELVEYGNIQGLILFSEISRKRIKVVSKVLQQDKIIVAEVINVDQDRKLIDVSKKNIKPEDIDNIMKQHHQRKKIYSIVKKYSKDHSGSVPDLYQTLIWNLPVSINEDSDNDPYYDYLNTHKDSIDWLSPYKHMLETTEKANIIAECEVTCFNIDGIDTIKNCLKHVQQNFPVVSIKLISSPSFLFAISESTNHEHDIQLLETCIQELIVYAQQFDFTNVKIKVSPHVQNE